ncbi:MAG: M23 family metallopeptidase, partial [Bacteroidales bacterium]
MFLSRIILISILFFNTLSDFPVDRTLFISPLRIPISLAANFGELRVDHFHSGIDIKTQGVTGKEVVAAADGYVFRIGVSPTGFGNALYLRHPSGYSTVYGHLEKFRPDIDAYVKLQQYERKSFA